MAEQDALITVEEDELITAETTNANNRYLENKISENATTLTNYLERELTRVENELEGEITSAQTTLQQNINELSATVNAINFMPDYSNTASYSKNTTYTVDAPGYLITHNTTTTDDGNTTVYITYKGVTRTVWSQSSSEDTDWTHDVMTFPLPTGASFRVTSSGNMNIWFFKCIGA